MNEDDTFKRLIGPANNNEAAKIYNDAWKEIMKQPVLQSMKLKFMWLWN